LKQAGDIKANRGDQNTAPLGRFPKDLRDATPANLIRSASCPDVKKIAEIGGDPSENLKAPARTRIEEKLACTRHPLFGH
jgi:hypothetical protein